MSHIRKIAALQTSLVTLLLLAASTNTALAASFKLHPSGFGEHSYSAWKGGEGLADNTGTQDQALYFQKFTTTPTFAAGVAVFTGFNGMTASGGILELEFWIRLGGDHCGAGAPRFNVRTTANPPGSGLPPIFIGCLGMTPGTVAMAPNGQMYLQRSFALTTGTTPLVSIAMVFDEGTD